MADKMMASLATRMMARPPARLATISSSWAGAGRAANNAARRRTAAQAGKALTGAD